MPPGFVAIMRDLLGTEAEAFLQSLEKEAAVAVRINCRKPGAVFENAVAVPWCRNGYYLEKRPVFTLDPLLHAGCYYVQDPSSMIYETVTKELVEKFRGQNSIPFKVKVLDLCAAPGGKTTAMINAVPDGSQIMANEYVLKRAEILRENLIKWGYKDAVVTNRPVSDFADEGENYDIVAVDAPCSGEGMMRKDPDARTQWNPELIESCSALQKNIIDSAIEALKPGGFLIYSTCTFNRTENEENAEYIAKNLGLEPIDLNFPKDWNIRDGIDTDLPVKRFMPHLTNGEGLFLAVFRKPGEWKPAAESAFQRWQNNTIPAKNVGKKNNPSKFKGEGKDKLKIERREKKEESDYPDIKEILSSPPEDLKYPYTDLSIDDARAYLRRESLILNPDVPRGIVIVGYKGHPLGLVKNIGSRANNLYPKAWRVLMR